MWQWYLVGLAVVLLVFQFVYDRYVQRKSTLLINYPVLGRMRYLFEILREPFRQYFGQEDFYESRDKIDWVYKAAKNVPNFVSFAVSQPFSDSRFVLRNSSIVLNNEEVSDDFSVVFGKEREIPFVSPSVISRSAMSDGALSPEATRAFVKGALMGNFPINTGEGGLTSNYFFDYKFKDGDESFFEVREGTGLQKFIYQSCQHIFNGAVAAAVYRLLVLSRDTADTFILDKERKIFFRPNWSAPLENYPKEKPQDMPLAIMQIGSGLYGVRDENGKFDDERYRKAMSFCGMTEIKIAQGAKQTGGKIVASKVTPSIAYYRGVEPYEDLMSPNRFPFAGSLEELYDFVGRLQDLSKKPVGIKIVISGTHEAEEWVKLCKDRLEQGKSYPDFFAVDSGEGGSATAPLELMESVGLNVYTSVYLMNHYLEKYGIRERVSLVGSGKILTPDDAAIVLSLGADMVSMARSFMMSGGCIRARHCSGAGSMSCPIGMATQDSAKRRSYLVYQKSKHIASYHENLIKGLKTILAVLGKDRISKLSKANLAFREQDHTIYSDVDELFTERLHL